MSCDIIVKNKMQAVYIYIDYTTHPLQVHPILMNLLAPGRSWWDFKYVIFNLALLIGIFKSSYDTVLRWMQPEPVLTKISNTI